MIILFLIWRTIIGGLTVFLVWIFDTEKKDLTRAFLLGSLLGIIGILFAIFFSAKEEYNMRESEFQAAKERIKNGYYIHTSSENKKILKQGAWECDICGKINYSYCGSCGCGFTKDKHYQLTRGGWLCPFCDEVNPYNEYKCIKCKLINYSLKTKIEEHPESYEIPDIRIYKEKYYQIVEEEITSTFESKELCTICINMDRIIIIYLYMGIAESVEKKYDYFGLPNLKVKSDTIRVAEILIKALLEKKWNLFHISQKDDSSAFITKYYYTGEIDYGNDAFKKEKFFDEILNKCIEEGKNFTIEKYESSFDENCAYHNIELLIQRIQDYKENISITADFDLSKDIENIHLKFEINNIFSTNIFDFMKKNMNTIEKHGLLVIFRKEEMKAKYSEKIKKISSIINRYLLIDDYLSFNDMGMYISSNSLVIPYSDIGVPSCHDSVSRKALTLTMCDLCNKTDSKYNYEIDEINYSRVHIYRKRILLT